jgi:MFS family permease
MFFSAFGFGVGPIVWLVITELFPSIVRSSYLAYNTAIFWAIGAIIKFLFPLLNKSELSFGWSCFIFALIMVFGGCYGLFLMPETAHLLIIEPNEADSSSTNDSQRKGSRSGDDDQIITTSARNHPESVLMISLDID